MKKEYSVYRANKGQGSAFRFKIDSRNDECTCWLSIANEKADGKVFDWENGINCKIGLADLAEMALVLEGRQDGIGTANEKGYYSGLFHKNANGNSTIDLSKSTQRPGFRLNVGRDNGGQKTRISTGLSVAEGYNLLQLIQHGILHLMTDNWQPDASKGKTAEPTSKASGKTPSKSSNTPAPANMGDDAPF